MNLMKQTIRPEFLNRVDEIVMFTPLTKVQIKDIVRLQFQFIEAMLEKSNMHAELTPKAVDWIVDHGYDPQFGARPVKRILQKYVINELSKKILAGTVNKENKITIDSVGDELVFSN
jgi:ATP-dependent Clp protease ATP-binding subunit ClpB